MARGSIRRRGRASWELKFDIDPNHKGKRQTRYVSFKGKRRDAKKELTRLLGESDAGTLPEPSKVTVAKHLRSWLESDHDLAPKTRERYLELAELQIIPHLGD